MDSPVSSAHVGHTLFVDGNSQSLYHVVAALRSASFRITIAFDGLQGYEKAITTKPDVIVSDLRLPRLDGIPLCRRLKANTHTSDIPVLFYTNHDDPQSRVLALEQGASDFIPRSRPHDEVIARIRIHAGISQRLHSMRKQQERLAQPSQPGPVDSDDHVAVRIIMKFVQENLAGDLSLNRLCSEVSMSKKRLNRAFENVCGCSAFAYVRDVRLSKAKHLLATTSMRTLTIAEDIGFSNSANFATAFMNAEGMSPTAYRQQIRRSQLCGGQKDINDE